MAQKLIRNEFKSSFKCREIADKNSARENLNFSAYMRNLILNENRVYTLSPDELNELRKQYSSLTRLGSNLNEILLHVNSRIKNSTQSLYITASEENNLIPLIISTKEILIRIEELLLNIYNKTKAE